MAIDVLRGAARGLRSRRMNALETFAIGEPDANLFGCPKCSRPLAVGNRRCPGCGVRLVQGVPFGKALGFVVVGMLAGVLAGGSIATGILMNGVLPVARAGSGAVTAPSAAPTASPVPVASPPPVVVAPAIPPSAVGALGQTAILNARIATNATALSRILANRSSTSGAIARGMRAIAADTTQGVDLAGRLVPWADAGPVATSLRDLYDEVTMTARDGLRAPLADKAAYRTAGWAVLNALKAMDGVDAQARALATSVGVELVPLRPTPEPTLAP